MLCYRCGSHVPETSESCGACGQKLGPGGVRFATATFSRRRLHGVSVEGAPYKEGDLIADRYTIKDTLATGPLGFVFRAHDTQVDVDVALKVIHSRMVQTPEERLRFEEVIRNGRKLSHPNLLRMYEQGVDHDSPFYTLQLFEGLTLRKIIEFRTAKSQFFALDEIDPILAQVARALDAAHKVGPHGDLKPENIIVLPDLLKVTDFGLGLAMPRVPFVQAMKARKLEHYLSPEYLRGEDIDARADIYALGVIIGEMLTGQVPDGAIPELRERNPDVPEAIDAVYRKALNENPLARYAKASELAAEFSEIVRSQPPRRKARGAGSSVPRDTVRERLAKSGDENPSQEIEISEVTIEHHSPDRSADVAKGVRPWEREEETEVTPPPVLMRQRSAHRWPLATLLTVLTLIGLGTGAAGGYWLLGEGFSLFGKGDKGPTVTADPSAPVTTAPVVQPAAPASDDKPKNNTQPAVLKTPENSAHKDATLASTTGQPVQSQPAVGENPGSGTDVKCPQGMRYISAGSFKRGTSKDDPMMGFDERPLASVSLSGYCIDALEYPNRKGSLPATQVSWNDARNLCENAGKRLCSEDEWEKACKGPYQARFAYGNGFDADACNTEDSIGEDRSLAASGKFSKCRSAYGVFDMSGNAAEWTSSNFSGSDKAIKGGAFGRPDHASRCSARSNGPISLRAADVGFRCCADVAR